MPTPVDKLPKLNSELLDKSISGQWLEFTIPATESGNKKFESPTLDEVEKNPEKTIEADFIRKVLLGLATDKPIVGVFIRGAIIKGKLDLRDASAKGFTLPPLRLDDCLILGDYSTDKQKKKNGEDNPVIDARYANLKRLTLKRSRIGIIDLRGAKIDGNLDMDSVQPIDENANACLIAENTTINGNIYLSGCQLRLNIHETIINGNLEYTDALCLYQATVNGSLFIYGRKDKNNQTDISNPEINGRIDLSFANIQKNIWIFNSNLIGNVRNRVKKDKSKTAIRALRLNAQSLRIENETLSSECNIDGHIELEFSNIKYAYFKNLSIHGRLHAQSIKVEDDIIIDTISVNKFEENNENEKKNPWIELPNADIGRDLALKDVFCEKVYAKNASIKGNLKICNFPPVNKIDDSWIDKNKEYSKDYKKRIINFDNADIGSDFHIDKCFVGRIKAKNIRVKGDTKFKDTFARFNLKLAVIEGELTFDNEEETIYSTIINDQYTKKKRAIIYSGIPKITANDIEVSGPVKLNCLEVNAEYYEEDAMPELDFSGGVFKGELRIGDITFRRTFKDSRPVFSLNDAKIDGDIHFEKNKQLRIHVDEFAKFFVDKRRNQSAGEEMAKAFIEKHAKSNDGKNCLKLVCKKLQDVDSEYSKLVEKLGNKTIKKYERRKLNLINFFARYSEGWEISKLNHPYIKKYKIPWYPQFEYVELIKDKRSIWERLKDYCPNKKSEEDKKEIASFLIHQTDKNYSIHLHKSEIIDWLNGLNINGESFLKKDAEDDPSYNTFQDEFKDKGADKHEFKGKGVEYTKHYSIAKKLGLRKIIQFFHDTEYIRYVLLHLMHVNFTMSGLTASAFKMDVNADKLNFGTGINLRLDGFEYKRIEDNDEMFKGAFTNVSFGESSESHSRSFPSHLTKDKFEGLEGILDKQYDNIHSPTHNGFDSQPYEHMARVLSSSGADRAAKNIIIKKIRHEVKAQNWLIKTKHRVASYEIKKPSDEFYYFIICFLIILNAILWITKKWHFYILEISYPLVLIARIIFWICLVWLILRFIKMIFKFIGPYLAKIFESASKTWLEVKHVFKNGF